MGTGLSDSALAGSLTKRASHAGESGRAEHRRPVDGRVALRIDRIGGAKLAELWVHQVRAMAGAGQPAVQHLARGRQCRSDIFANLPAGPFADTRPAGTPWEFTLPAPLASQSGTGAAWGGARIGGRTSGRRLSKKAGRGAAAGQSGVWTRSWYS